MLPEEQSNNTFIFCRTWVRGAVVLMILLGLTWTFGLLYLNQASMVMAYIFTILNSLQGLFIFIFHCVQNDKVSGLSKGCFTFIWASTWHYYLGCFWAGGRERVCTFYLFCFCSTASYVSCCCCSCCCYSCVMTPAEGKRKWLCLRVCLCVMCVCCVC